MAENYTNKRRGLASEAVKAVDRLLEAVWELDQIRQITVESGGGFVDADVEVDVNDNAVIWNGIYLSHLNAWKLNVLLNIVVPGLVAGLEDHLEDNPEAATYKQILLAVKP